VQVEPIKPTLKAPRTKRLNLNYNELLSDVAYKFSFRRYTTALKKRCKEFIMRWHPDKWHGKPLAEDSRESIMVGQCSLTLSTPR